MSDSNCRKTNYEVMVDTQHGYKTNPKLVDAVKNAIFSQFMVAEKGSVDLPGSSQSNTKYIASIQELEKK